MERKSLKFTNSGADMQNGIAVLGIFAIGKNLKD
jgi:hypothetical protein